MLTVSERHRPRPGSQLPKGMRATEDDYLATVVSAARWSGWRVHHCRPAFTERGWRTPIQGDAGFPDLVLVHPLAKRTLWVELKAPGGRLTQTQQLWGETLIAAGQTYRVLLVPEQLQTFCQELADLAAAPLGVVRTPEHQAIMDQSRAAVARSRQLAEQHATRMEREGRTDG